MSRRPAPRVVTVSRHSELDELLTRHGTRAAAAHYLRQRGRTLNEVVDRHDGLAAALTTVSAAVPADWRRGQVTRDELPRFLFTPEDIVVVVGQDGLVANVAKYLDGQPAIGVDPEPGRNVGVLVRFTAAAAGRLLPAIAAGRVAVQERTMVHAELDDGQELIDLNEIYIGHATHQSARYLLSVVSERPALAGPGGDRSGATSIGRERVGALLVRPGGVAVAGDRSGPHRRPVRRRRVAATHRRRARAGRLRRRAGGRPAVDQLGAAGHRPGRPSPAPTRRAVSRKSIC